MPRIARTVVAGVPHHVTQRGNRREIVFFSDSDRRRYLELLQEYSLRHSVEVLAYCLMDNHLHLVVVPRHSDSLAVTLKPVHLRYAQHVNWTQNMTGRLWQGRFFSCPLDEAHCLAAIRYVERNPVRAGMVKRAEDYPFSSAADHVGQRTDPLLSRDSDIEAAIDDWSQWLRAEDDESVIEGLRQHTRTGRPLGSAGFIDRLERKLGRVLRPKPGGRPRRKPGRRRKASS
jgi:putative transposase